ncbi:MAG: PadR family transcriptional regulator [Clostridia bacterium]|nr:MAG: PadR family transcriptional regulator [Clostridia bacterium]
MILPFLQEDKTLNKELKRGTLELAILAILARGDIYGYELASMLAAESDGCLAVKEGTLYPLLHRLEDAGCIVSYWETEPRGVPRKYYHLTPTGREYLHNLAVEWALLASKMDGILARAGLAVNTAGLDGGAGTTGA